MPNSGPRRVLLLGTENSDGTVVGVTSGTSVAISAPDRGIASVYLRSIGTTSGGTIIIEESDSTESERVYSGTWSQMASIAASSFTGGAQSANHFANSAYGQIRVRISSPITGGGTITAVYRDQAGG
jgi:hypothetical protein